MTRLAHYDDRGDRLRRGTLTRRDFIWLVGAASAASLSGCATSPVTGESILVGMSEADEISSDKRAAPHQFTKDLGAVQDDRTNRYIADVGKAIDARSHRPGMPYNYRALNANYVNAYTFPAGSIGVTRGILTEMNDEAELAALLGHEVGHVNARHTAQRQGQAMVAQAALVGLQAGVAGSRYASFGGLVGLAGQVGASALLSSYSRSNEREADALGMEYMNRAGYPPDGMVRLHQLLVSQHKSQPSLLQTMFSTHPMAEERVENAQALARTKYASTAGASPRRERFMDETSRVRALKPTIQGCQRGEAALSKQSFPQAEEGFQAALGHTPNDYAANVLMAQALVAQRRHDQARGFIERARSVYPSEGQAMRLSAANALGLNRPEVAHAELTRFEAAFPGDPSITFMKGVSLEGAGNRRAAAEEYQRFLKVVRQGEAASFAQQRLKAMGFAPPAAK